MIMPAWVFPVVTISLNIGSAIVYACHGDLKRCIYWLAAAVLTTTVTL